MEETLVDKQSLIASLQSKIDELNSLIKKGDLGTNDINHIKVRKSNLSNQIKLLNAKGSASEEDQMNTSRLVAISAASIHTLSDKRNQSGSGLTLLIISAISIGALLYYLKTKKG